MSATRKDTAEFYFYMARHTQATPGQCEMLLRYAATLHRLDVEHCNRLETSTHKQKVARIQKKVNDICLRLCCAQVVKNSPIKALNDDKCAYCGTPNNCRVYFTWEPMAPPFIIRTSDGFSNYAGDVKGIAVPA